MDPDSRTPLLWASSNSHEGVVKLLFTTGRVDVNSKNCYNESPLFLAAWYDHEVIVKLLLETGRVDVDSKVLDESRTPLSLAPLKGREGQ